MSKRKIIEIDGSKCDGCEQCVSACHEGAIAMVHGKAKLVSDVYCDGFAMLGIDGRLERPEVRARA